MIPINEFVDGLRESISLFKPEAALIVTLVVVILADLIFSKIKHAGGYAALAGLAVTGWFLFDHGSGEAASTFTGMLAVDPFAMFFKVLIFLATIVVIVMAFFSKELEEKSHGFGEYYTLTIGMAVGMFLLAGASNLIMIYLAIEIMSMCSYVLAGYTKEVKRSSEASLKYVIYGSLSSGIMIYGISILFGLTGTLNLYEINAVLAAYDGTLLPVLASGLMILAGIAYKISAVPFHFWTPDVYEGAPVAVTAYLGVASKAAGFAVLIRFVKVAFIVPDMNGAPAWISMGTFDWQMILSILSVVTMTLGNLVALWQSNVKRMLAYSSIAHAGYLLMGVTVMTEVGIMGINVYFFMYLLMNLGAFLVVQLIANKIDSEELDDYVGLGYKAPFLGVAMCIFMVSLAGIPPTAGFIGKWQLFTAVLDKGMIWLAVVGVLNSVVSLFYYSKVFRNMWMRGVDDNAEKLEYSVAAKVFVYILAVPTLLIGIFFQSVLDWARESVQIFM